MKLLSEVGGFFVSKARDVFTEPEAKTIEDDLIGFVKTDVGRLAMDAVTYVEDAMQGAGSELKREAAVLKLKADAAAAGKDLVPLAESTLNLFIEAALQVLVAQLAAHAL